MSGASAPRWSASAHINPFRLHTARVRRARRARNRPRGGAGHPLEISFRHHRRGAGDRGAAARRRRLCPEEQSRAAGTGRARALREVAERARRRAAEREIARLTRRLKMQSGINSAVIRIRDRDELLREACRLAHEVGAYDSSIVFRVASDGRTATPWYWLGTNDSAGIIPPVLRSAMARNRTPVSPGGRYAPVNALCADLSRSEPPVAIRDKLLRAGLRSLVVLPLIVDGAPVGALALASREAHVVSDEELRLFRTSPSTSHSRFATSNRSMPLEYLASFDPMTGLAKRTLFCHRLDQRLRNRLPLRARRRWPHSTSCI